MIYLFNEYLTVSLINIRRVDEIGLALFMKEVQVREATAPGASRARVPHDPHAASHCVRRGGAGGGRGGGRRRRARRCRDLRRRALAPRLLTHVHTAIERDAPHDPHRHGRAGTRQLTQIPFNKIISSERLTEICETRLPMIRYTQQTPYRDFTLPDMSKLATHTAFLLVYQHFL